MEIQSDDQKPESRSLLTHYILELTLTSIFLFLELAFQIYINLYCLQTLFQDLMIQYFYKNFEWYRSYSVIRRTVFSRKICLWVAS